MRLLARTAKHEALGEPTVLDRSDYNSGGPEIAAHDLVIGQLLAADALLAGREPAVVPVEGIKAIKIITSVYESAKTGKEVFLK